MSKEKRRRPKIILWLGIIILLIPCILLGVVLYNSLEDSSQPVEGDRFVNELDPAISESQLEQIRSSIDYADVEKFEVNLISATLRILVDTNDDLPEENVSWLADDIYEKVNAVLPVETYFTNTENTKMYDVEIHVYNVLNANENYAKYYIVKSKTGASEGALVDNLSRPKNESLANSILYPATDEELDGNEGPIVGD